MWTFICTVYRWPFCVCVYVCVCVCVCVYVCVCMCVCVRMYRALYYLTPCKWVQFVCTLDSCHRKKCTFLCLPVVAQTDYFPEGKTSGVESYHVSRNWYPNKHLKILRMIVIFRGKVSFVHCTCPQDGQSIKFMPPENTEFRCGLKLKLALLLRWNVNLNLEVLIIINILFLWQYPTSRITYLKAILAIYCRYL